MEQVNPIVLEEVVRGKRTILSKKQKLNKLEQKEQLEEIKEHWAKFYNETIDKRKQDSK